MHAVVWRGGEGLGGGGCQSKLKSDRTTAGFEAVLRSCKHAVHHPELAAVHAGGQRDRAADGDGRVARAKSAAWGWGWAKNRISETEFERKSGQTSSRENKSDKLQTDAGHRRSRL